MSFENPAFKRALLNSFVFTISSQVLGIFLANILALALKDVFRGRRLIRFLVLLPWVAPVSVGAIGWPAASSPPTERDGRSMSATSGVTNRMRIASTGCV